MSLLRDFNFREVSSFGGAWLLPDPSMVDIRGALLARNVEYSAGQVETRTGYQPIDWNSLTVYTSSQMYAWYAPFSGVSATFGDVALATFSTAHGAIPGIQVTNIKSRTNVVSTIGPSDTSAVGASMVGVGLTLYAAYYNASQRGVAGGLGGYATFKDATHVIYGPLFPPPWKAATFAAVGSGVGVVTAGAHRVGFILEYASGFTGRASPDSGTASPPSISSFTPITVTAAGGTGIAVSLTPAGLGGGLDVVAFSVIMTTTGNLNQYYIVPGSRTLLDGTAHTLNSVTVNISDSDLNSQSIDATPYLYRLTCDTDGFDQGGTGPFYPSHLCLFGDRMAYKGYRKDGQGNLIDCLYISDRNDYQAITADQHLVQLPGQRNTTTMFRMSGSNYLVGPHEIYSVADTGDVPATWPAPQLVDGRTGTLAIHGVEVSPSGQYAWIADQAGLFLFQGSPITSLAVSYNQSPDWARINWDAAYTVQLKDDASRQRLYILVPLDGATTPTHIMTFDYTDGPSYLTVRYSLDSISGYNIGAIELIRNELPGQATGNQKMIELWLGPRTGTTYLRKTSALDTTPYHDVTSTAIASTYRTCPLPGRDATNGLVQMHHGFHARLKGAGSITPTLYDIDAARSFACRTATLAAAPDLDTLFLAEMRGELAFVEFATNTVDTHWQIAYLKYYSSPYISQR